VSLPSGPDASATGPRPPDATLIRAAEAGGRPTGVVVLAILRLADAAVFVLAAIGVGLLSDSERPPEPWFEIVRLGLVALAMIAVIAAVGLLRTARWGWVLTMVMVGFGLAGDLIQIVIGSPNDIQILILVVSAFYLNQRDLRIAFRVARR